MKLEEEILSNIGSGQDFREFTINCVLSSLTVRVVFSNKNTIWGGATVFMKAKAQEKLILLEYNVLKKGC